MENMSHPEGSSSEDKGTEQQRRAARQPSVAQLSESALLKEHQPFGATWDHGTSQKPISWS